MHHQPRIIVTFTREQVRAVDQAAVEQYAIPGIILMENAANAIEEAALDLLENLPDDAPILIFAGPGNNGGDGLAVARKLHNRGRKVFILLAAPASKFSGDAKTNFQIADRMDLPIHQINGDDPASWLDRFTSEHAIPDAALLIDALLGTGITSEPRSPMDAIIQWMNARRGSGSKTLAIDVPTGLDCDSGRPFGEPCITADCTITMAGQKSGFTQDHARQYTGDVCVGDIGVPVELLRKLGQG